jgi:hypothetical protein
MQHIDLDAREESVKQFVLSLAGEPQGAVLELNGRAIAWVVPLPPDNGASSDEDWTEAKNARRCALIDREVAGTLTPQEAGELRRLQEEMLRHRRRVAPLPLADARALHQDLLARAQAGSQTDP